MQCLEHKPAFSLRAAAGKTDTFVADIFQPRPEFDAIVAFSGPWCSGAAESVRASMNRSGCAMDFVQLAVDEGGMLALLHFRRRVTLAHAKVAVVAILSYLPQAQRDIVEAGLRPFDELDYNRIVGWKTAEDVRPPLPAKERAQRAREARDAEVVEAPVMVAKFLEPLTPERRKKRAADAKAAEVVETPMTLVEFLAAQSDSDDEGHSNAPPLMLTDAVATSVEPEDISAITLLDPAAYSWFWLWRVRREATIIMVEVGCRPGRFSYHHCHREARRQLLMQRAVSAQSQTPGMLQVVRTAMDMATAGAIPQPGTHGRRREFIQRCADTLKAICPSAETDLMKLGNETQTLIRMALGGTVAPFAGCLTLGCLDADITWVVHDLALRGEPPMPMSVCSRCDMPKSFGRTVNSIGDILSLTSFREHGRNSARLDAILQGRLDI